MEKIFYKQSPTEFEVQAVAYGLLIEAGYITRGELKIRKSHGKHRGARFDLIVFNESFEAVLTIEVKDNPEAPQHSKKAHYENLAGVPNIQISGMSQARDVVQIVRKHI